MPNENGVITRIVLHIEDEFSHWANLNETIEAAILEYLILIDENTYDTFEYHEPESETESPVITRMTWSDNRGKHELIWILNFDDDLTKLIKGKVFEKTKPENRFFILDASKRTEEAHNPSKTLFDNFTAIDPFVYDTEENIRVFTAYRKDIAAGTWDLNVPYKKNGEKCDDANINDLSHLVISKTGVKGRNSELPGELKELVMRFITKE